MRWALIILCLLCCTPVFADRVSDLEELVADQQEQIWELQRQMQLVLRGQGERTIGTGNSPNTERIIPRKEPRIAFALKPGYMELHREEPPSGFSSGRVGGSGPGISAEMDIRALHRLSFNLTFDGTLDRLGGKQSLGPTSVGGDVTAIPPKVFDPGELTDRTRLLVGSPNLRYRVISSERASLDFSTGFEILSLRFRAMDKYVSGVTRLRENYFGYGPRFGLVANFNPMERFNLSTEGFYTTFLDLEGNKGTGTDFPTEGHAFRLDMGASYEVYKGLSLGAGYRGYLLSIDQSKTKRGVGNMGEENIRTDLFYGSLEIAF